MEEEQESSDEHEYLEGHRETHSHAKRKEPRRMVVVPRSEFVYYLTEGGKAPRTARHSVENTYHQRLTRAR